MEPGYYIVEIGDKGYRGIRSEFHEMSGGLPVPFSSLTEARKKLAEVGKGTEIYSGIELDIFNFGPVKIYQMMKD